MKKILLLSSILFIFLSACGIAETPIPATPTSTLVPPATATEAATAAAIATATATVNWNKLNDTQRHDLAPETVTIDGVVLTESNTSTVNPNVIIYRNSLGEGVMVFNGKEFVTLQAAGIIELAQNGTPPAKTFVFYDKPDGKPFEVRSYTEKSAEKGLSRIQREASWVMTGGSGFVKRSEENMKFITSSPNYKELLGKLYSVPGYDILPTDQTFPTVGDSFFCMRIGQEEQGNIIVLWQNKDSKLEVTHFNVDKETFMQIIEDFPFTPLLQ